MIFVVLAVTVAMFAYAVYGVVNPVAAGEWWVRYINGGWRPPTWLDTDGPYYIPISRVLAAWVMLVTGVGTVLLIQTIVYGPAR